MARNKSQEDYAKTALRLPRDLHREVHEVAKAQERTFNGQLVVFIREGVQAHAQQQPQGAQQ